MNGVRLICRTLAGDVFYSLPSAMVESSPEIKYMLEKQNAFDPSMRIQRNPWWLVKIDVRSPIIPAQYNELMNHLALIGTHYIEWYQNSVLQQLPVSITALPACPDDLNQYPELVTFKCESRYVTRPGVITWGVVAASDDAITVIPEI